MCLVRSVAVVAIGSLVAGSLLVGGGTASASLVRAVETHVCWHAGSSDSAGPGVRVIRCRIAGQYLRDFVGRPPVPLQPAVDLDGDGCWYQRSWGSQWRLDSVQPDGTAALLYDIDGVPGGPQIAEGVFPQCRAEPAGVPPDIEYAWRIVADMTLMPHIEDVQPADPLTGLATFLVLTSPGDQTGALVSPFTGHQIQVRARPEALQVDWGDSSPALLHDPADPHLSAGRSGGGISHVYETSAGVELLTRLEWDVGWRVDDGAWRRLAVPPQLARLPLTVGQVVSRLH